MKQRAIKFVRPWQGRQVDQIVDNLAPGVVATLVDYGFAKYVEPEQEKPRRRGRPPKRQTSEKCQDA